MKGFSKSESLGSVSGRDPNWLSFLIGAVSGCELREGSVEGSSKLGLQRTVSVGNVWTTLQQRAATAADEMSLHPATITKKKH